MHLQPAEPTLCLSSQIPEIKPSQSQGFAGGADFKTRVPMRATFTFLVFNQGLDPFDPLPVRLFRCRNCRLFQLHLFVVGFSIKLLISFAGR